MRKTLAILALFLLVTPTFAADWPQYRADAARTAYAEDDLPTKPTLCWRYEARHAPQPAWCGPDTRMAFDYAYQPAIADGRLFFGSSADGKVYALDAATGEELWAFFTNGPIRFAPAVWRDRVFAASDDGFLYCLDAATGQVRWQLRGGPADDLLLGNGKMVSRWPVRGAPAILDDIVYFGAGIWPSEGIYLYAINTATGNVLWLNDESGGIEMDQPHPTARAKSGVSAQGYFAAGGNDLLIPTGRAVPAGFDRKDGALRFFHLQANRAHGGGLVMHLGDCFVNSGVAWNAATGLPEATLNARVAAASPEYLLCGRGGELQVYDRANLFVDKDTTDRKGNPVKKRVMTPVVWSLDVSDDAVVSLIVAANQAIAGTESGQVVGVDLSTKSAAWTQEVDGLPLALAAAEGRLYVGTDKGLLYCFGEAIDGKPAVIKPKRVKSPYPRFGEQDKAAEAILAASQISEGYCVDLGCGDGRLAYELAKRSDLYIVGIDPDPENVRVAREKLDAASFYGTRVTIHLGDPAHTQYAPSFANLVVSANSLEGDIPDALRHEASRLQRPYGGVICVGPRKALETSTRGPVEHAGVWTHQYSDPANTCCSTDTLVKGPLEMLWFVDNELEMPSRHGRGPGPLFAEGRMFVEGIDALRTLDAYNGRILWEYPLDGVLVPYDQEHLVGTAATQSNICYGDGSVFVRKEGRCFRLDAVTGEKLAEYTPPDPGTWGYIAYVDGTLYGSIVIEKHVVKWAFVKSDMTKIFTESSVFFALDAETGALKWRYDAQESIRHNAIAIAEGRVFLVDRPLVLSDLLQPPSTIPEETGNSVLLALDAETGNVVWQTDEDVYGTLLAVSTKHDVLLMTQQHTRFKLKSEVGGRMTAFRASDGTRLWDAPSDPQGKASRPILNDTVIYNEPGAWDLLTGKRLDFDLQRSYGCGIISSSPNLMLYRSATLGYFNLLDPKGTENYGGIRPGCWINALPVGGIVLMPEASNRCTCSYLIKATIALQPKA